MQKMFCSIKNFFKCLQPYNYIHIAISVLAITVVACVFRGSVLAVFVAIFGVLNANLSGRGHIAGAFFAILQSVFYAIVAFQNAYYGEIIIYLGFYIPFSIVSIITWIKNLNSNEKLVVNVNKLKIKEWAYLIVVACLIGIGGFFLLRAFNTTNLILSTVSLVTGAFAAYCNMRRERMMFVFYGLNCIIFTTMWIMTIIETGQLSFITMLISTFANFVSDIYGFINWTRQYNSQTDSNQIKGDENGTFSTSR